jgi:antitoxin (DNA-binding transcriptional repressor) of toxin-antitoxin stability system
MRNAPSALISEAEADKIGVSALVRQAEAGHDHVVLRNDKPVAAVVGISRLEEIDRLEDDLLDICLASARMLTTGESRHALGTVLEQFGYTRQQLRETAD